MIRFIDKMNIEFITEAMVIKKGTSGLYRCTRLTLHTREDEVAGSLYIGNGGVYSCKCGLSGKGFISLYAKLYNLPYDQAAERLIERIKCVYCAKFSL